MNDNLLNRLSLREAKLRRVLFCAVWNSSFSSHKKDIRQIVSGPKLGINSGILGSNRLYITMQPNYQFKTITNKFDESLNSSVVWDSGT